MAAVNVKLAKRAPISLSHLWERAGERETGITSFMIRGDELAMPVSGLLKILVPSRAKRAWSWYGKNSLIVALLLTMNSSYAVDYGSVTENAVILYNKPSIESKKLYVASRYMPLEQAVSLDNWVKVRDSSGNMAWIEKRFLSGKRYVITTDTQVAFHQAPEEKSAVVAQVKKQIT